MVEKVITAKEAMIWLYSFFFPILFTANKYNQVKTAIQHTDYICFCEVSGTNWTCSGRSVQKNL